MARFASRSTLFTGMKGGPVAVPVCPAMSRRQFLGAAGATAAAATMVGTGAFGVMPARAVEHGSPFFSGRPAPSPIAATVPTVGPDDPPLDPPFDFIHWLLPGPPDATTPVLGLPGFGLDVDPSLMGDYQGFTAYSVIAGQADGSDGVSYDVELDVRVMDGNYVAADGSRQRGTFAFF